MCSGEANTVQSQDDDETLACLGLTVLQAKVYMTLIRFGQSATIKSISQVAHLARQEVCRVNKELYKKGLIERIVKTPNEFKAIPLQQAINMLYHHRNKENIEAYSKAMIFLKRHRDRFGLVKIGEEQEQFVMIPAFETHVMRFYKSLDKAQQSIESVISFNSIAKAYSDENEPHKKALKRSVKMHYITEKPKDEAKASKIIVSLKKAGDFSIRHMGDLPSLFFGIIDRKEIFIAISPSRIATESQCLWSNSRGIIEVFQAYFDAEWKKAQEVSYPVKQKN
jgi:sugar-specific transcriptional regulator TrmB